MPRRAKSVPEEPKERLEDRWLLEAQTARNLAGLEAEQAGRIEEAITLYERNVAEGFPSDWPYGRLVSIYERRQQLEDAERVLRRGIEVVHGSSHRTAQDRRAMVQVFRRRLSLVTKQRKQLARDQRRQPISEEPGPLASS